MKGILIEEQDEVYRLIDQKELDEINASAEEFDGFTGIRIVGRVQPEVKVNFAKVNEVIDELMEKNLNKERWQMRPDNWREFVGYEKALKELKTILSKISA